MDFFCVDRQVRQGGIERGSTMSDMPNSNLTSWFQILLIGFPVADWQQQKANNPSRCLSSDACRKRLQKDFDTLLGFV
jgi:hypothetical protein